MARSRTIFLSALLVLSLAACDSKRLTPGGEGGGIGVGNGMRASTETASYYSPKYQYGFKYSADLNFREVTPEIITIDNTSIIERQGFVGKVKPSSLKAETLTPTMKLESLEALREYAGSLHRTEELVFHPVERVIPGAKGVAAETHSKSDSERHTIYYFLTTNDTLLRIRTDLDLRHVSWQDIENIVSSFTYDATPPKITSFWLNTQRFFPAGGGGSLSVRVTDDFSGLVGGHVSSVFYNNLESGSAINTEDTIRAQDYDAKKGILTLRYRIPKWSNHGLHVLYMFTISDAAGNEAQVSLNDNPRHRKNTLLDNVFNPTRTYFLQVSDQPIHNFNTHPIIIPVWNFTNNTDLKPPKVGELKFLQQKFSISPEQPLLRVPVQMRASDDASGVIGGKVSVRLEQVEGEKVGQGTSAQHIVVKEDLVGPDLYRFDLDFGRNLPGGKYKATYEMVTDLATELPNWVYGLVFGTKRWKELKFPLELELKSDGAYDFEQPEVQELASETASISPSRPGILRLRVRDNLSGFEGGRLAVRFIPTDPKVQRLHLDAEISLTQQQVVKGWITLPIKVSPYMPKGSYKLKYISLDDGARNRLHLTSTPLGKPGPIGDELLWESDTPDQMLLPYKTKLPVPELIVTTD